MLALRYLKIFVVLLAGLFGFFVVLGNLLDYDSNYQFVKHVLSMDTTFEGNKLMWRAITSPNAHMVAYWILILLEVIFTLTALFGAYHMLLNSKQSGLKFNEAKRYGYYAFFLGFIIWFLGFIVIGNEWFAMWQSESWNGKDTAMNIVLLWTVFALLLALKDDDLQAKE
ncbi:DUF2165 family protein [Kurthia sibirica]|uniref:DUF2165 domain-containing protein n=1 Tax=Kurthia sibirica TaxID=202750 RepID=A0A2U3AKV3_9BACL|nr:DUF2165 domain-containing protein [Kurthia sibirica]PWI25165.1 hypothetical protein DEX24_09520 [Kurthia sibirica]GEK33252.1 hypothetical protein KSI01_07850 [Kurthia sibirica]